MVRASLAATRPPAHSYLTRSDRRPRRRVQPAAHGRADQQGAAHDARDARIPDGLRVVLGQTDPVDERPEAQQNHAVAVRLLRPAHLLRRHGGGCRPNDRKSGLFSDRRRVPFDMSICLVRNSIRIGMPCVCTCVYMRWIR